MGFSEGPEREKIGQGLKMKRDWTGTGNDRNRYKVGEGASCSKVWVGETYVNKARWGLDQGG